MKCMMYDSHFPGAGVRAVFALVMSASMRVRGGLAGCYRGRVGLPGSTNTALHGDCLFCSLKDAVSFISQINFNSS